VDLGTDPPFGPLEAEPAAVGPGSAGRQRIPRPEGAIAGDPAPWSELGPVLGNIGLDEVRRAFAVSGPPRRSARESEVSQGSAVLAPLYEHGGETYVILTRRSPELRVHSGEVSFAGGRREPGESLADTARREAQEEISLEPGAVEMIGELDHLTTITSGSFIVPYVAALESRPILRPNPGEVEAVLHVPLSELLDPAIYRSERWPLWGSMRPIFFFELAHDTVWGATAAMLRQLLGLATGTVPRGGLDHL